MKELIVGPGGGGTREKVTPEVEFSRAAVTVACWAAATAFVPTTNCAEVVFAATVTDAGAVSTEAALLERFTGQPAAGAALESVTVQAVEELALRFVELHCRLTVVGQTSDTVTEALLPLAEATRVAFWSDVSAPVLIVNVDVVAPTGTLQEPGALSGPEALLVSVPLTPPAGAGWLSVTVHDVLWLASSEGDPHPMEDTVIVFEATSEMVAEELDPFSEAVTLANWLAAIEAVAVAGN